MTANDKLTERFTDIITEAAQYLCNNYGHWGATKATAMTTWSLHECGVVEKFKNYFIQTLEELIAKNGIKSNKGLSFDDEIWETSVVLIALSRVDRELFKKEIELIKKWLLSEISEDNRANFKNEPWETMWVITALFESGDKYIDNLQLIKRCISWILDKRNIEGVLISLHYMGFLLTVLNYAVRELNLNKNDLEIYQEAIDRCEKYLVEEFENSKKAGMLWTNEPWSIGHILLGIAESPNLRKVFSQNHDINEYILSWYENRWSDIMGWGSLKDTCDTLVGLMKYYCMTEVELHKDEQSQAITKISGNIVLEDEDMRSKKMAVYPIWGVGVDEKENEVLLLMPYKEDWSDKLAILIEELLEEEGWTVQRADKVISEDAIDKIWQFINAARLIIVDITGEHPNVMYELGIVHTLGKRSLILTQKDPNTIPFNLRKVDVIQYNIYERDGKRKLEDNILKGIEQIFKRKR
jgi:hypothetical protein